jgi:hypothetical protein
MATGRLGVQAVPATTLTTVYTVPTGYYAVLGISITNRNTSAVTIRVATAATGTPSVEEYIEYDTVVVGSGVFERTGIVLQAGLNVVVYSNTANVGCTIFGIETSTA